MKDDYAMTIGLKVPRQGVDDRHYASSFRVPGQAKKNVHR